MIKYSFLIHNIFRKTSEEFPYLVTALMFIEMMLDIWEKVIYIF